MSDEDEELYQQRLRERESRSYESTRLWSKTPNEVGMIAEKKWHAWNGLPMDLRDHKYGDGGIDAMVMVRLKTLPPHEFASDVKGTVMRDPHLNEKPESIENGKIYVLGFVQLELRLCNLMGWCWGYTLKQQPLRDRYGNEPCHSMRWNHPLMRSMFELRDMVISARHSTREDLWWKANKGARR